MSHISLDSLLLSYFPLTPVTRRPATISYVCDKGSNVSKRRAASSHTSWRACVGILAIAEHCISSMHYAGISRLLFGRWSDRGSQRAVAFGMWSVSLTGEMNPSSLSLWRDPFPRSGEEEGGVCMENRRMWWIFDEDRRWAEHIEGAFSFNIICWPWATCIRSENNLPLSSRRCLLSNEQHAYDRTQ